MAARWTEDELEYLHDNIGVLSYQELSRHFKKSIDAIKMARVRHGIPSFYDNILSSGMLSLELGRCRATIRKWRKRGWIKYNEVSWTAQYGKHPVIYKEEDIVSFLKEHYKLFNFRAIPNRYFANIVEDCYQKAS